MMKLVEFNNRISRKLNLCVHEVHFVFCTFFARVLLRSTGVHLGKSCSFKGWTSVYRCTGSGISVGGNCVFCSSPWHNPLVRGRCAVKTMLPGAEVRIGDGCGFSSVAIFSFRKVVLGNNVRVGANCVIMDGDFHLDDPRAGEPAEIEIGDDVWLGEGVKVLKGVKIGRGSVIGAGSVVTADIPENVVAAGVPCRVVKSLCE